MKKIIAYHFTSDRLRDGRPIPKIGEWLVHEKPLILCLQGLHASLHPADALKYAPGVLLHLVELSGRIIYSNDKVVAEKRKIIATIDAKPLLEEYVRKCALMVYPLWGNNQTDPDGLCLKYLKTGNESLRKEAAEAARAATRVAWAAGAAGAATWAAWAATWAAWAATRVAWTAGATWPTAKAKQRKLLQRLVNKHFKNATKYDIGN